jgi:outer membrane receptor protein involved in Fe transport
MSRNTPLSVAVHRALSSIAIATTAVAVPALSQAQEAERPERELEEITVTGSRIATDANLISSSPVSRIDAEELTYRGITRVEDLVNDLPQMTPEFTANDSNGATGTATLDLRGLGSDRTLVLVNGHRMGFGDPFALAPDINQIPGALIERVELLTGGASSTYGSDAMAGVVNFIMKNDFEGFQLDFQYSGYQHNQGNGGVQEAIDALGFEQAPDDVTDGGTTNVNLLVGMNTADGRGNITAYLGYRDINSVLQSGRDFSACALANNDDNSPECGGSLTKFPAVVTDFAGTYYDVVGDQFVPWDGSYYNYGPLNYFQRPDTRFTGGFFGHYDVNDRMEGYAELMFMDDRSRSQIAASGAFFVTDTINCSNAFLSAQQFGALGCTSPADVAPFYIGRRNVEGGPRIDDLRHTSFRMLAGLRGDITDNWGYDVSANFSRLSFSETYLNDMSTTRIIRALDVVADPDTGEPVCASVLNDVDPTCVPWNLFEEGQVTQEAIDYLVLPLFSRADLEMDQIVAFVNGDLSDIGVVSPWASDGVEAVFGAEYREEVFDFNPDSGFQTGDGAGQGGPIPAVAGSQDVTEFFTEFRIPVVQDRPGFQELTLDLRYRFSDYSTGVNADTYNIGGSWTPVEGIKLRGGYSRAVRAPNLREQFEPQSLGLWGGVDPCAGPTPELTAEACANTGVSAAQYGSIPLSPAQQYNEIAGGNPDLAPEKSDSITVGAVFTPDEMLPGLTFSIDYWQIEIEDAIDTVEPEFIIRQCAASGDPLLCDPIDRGPNGNLWIGQAAVTSTNVNIGFFEVAGIDLVGNYGWEIGNWGGLDFGFRGTVLEKFDEEPVPGSPLNECAGTYGGSCTRPRPEWKHTLNTVWTTPWDLQAIVGWRYVGEVDSFVDGEPSIGGENYVDLGATYYAEWFGSDNGTTLNAGISNVFDNDPPANGFLGGVDFANGNTVPGTWDALGRYYFVGFTQTF